MNSVLLEKIKSSRNNEKVWVTIFAQSKKNRKMLSKCAFQCGSEWNLLFFFVLISLWVWIKLQHNFRVMQHILKMFKQYFKDFIQNVSKIFFHHGLPSISSVSLSHFSLYIKLRYKLLQTHSCLQYTPIKCNNKISVESTLGNSTRTFFI